MPGLVLALALTLGMTAGCGESADQGLASSAAGGDGAPGTDTDTATTVAAGENPGDTADVGGADGSDPNGDGDGASTGATTGAGGNGDGDGEPLPGQPFDIGPGEGQVMAVVGVRHDDVLNLRSRPDPEAAIVATAAPLAGTPEIRSAGEGRLLDPGAWWKLTVGGQEAWANLRFVAALGTSDDLLAELSGQLGSLEAATIDDLVAAIADARGSEDPPSRTVEVAPPTPTSRTFDLLDLGDDAIRGERIAITVDAGDGQVTLVAAERTLICSRGVSDDGLCL